ncbi:MAG TPA: hypothetical protein VIC59_10265 [Gemmatimonadota bacterium]|jgi:hypothetical protein
MHRFRTSLAITLLAALGVSPRLGAQEVETSDYIRVVDQADRGEMVFLIGPVDLPAGHGPGGHMHMGGVPLQVVTFPRAGWIHGFLTDMVDAGGVPLTESFLHHVNVIDPDHRELFSPISQRIMAAGPETGKKELPPSMGLPVEQGQRLLVRAVFHNPTPTAHDGVYLRIRFEFTPSQAGEGRAGVFPVYIDVRPPVGPKAFDLPPGVSTQSWEGSPAVTGRLLAAGGHMHQYGKGLVLEDLTDPKVLWKVEPKIDAQGNIQSIPIGSFWKKGGVPMRADHVYRLTVIYDNPTGATIPSGGMGTLGGVFIPEPGETWPDVARQDPQYVADLAYTRGGGTAMGAEMDASSGAAAGGAADAASGEQAHGEHAHGEQAAGTAPAEQPDAEGGPARAAGTMEHMEQPAAEGANH